MKRPKISTILHLAADKYLAKDGFDFVENGKAKYSCHAIEDAAIILDYSCLEDIFKGLQNMGCPIYSADAFVTLGYPFSTDRYTQSARYIWLKWAALMAEEQGV